jgi:hypothetical protein
MVSFSPPENVTALQQILGQISRKLRDMEIEELVFFNPGVEERLKKVGGDIPDRLPPGEHPTGSGVRNGQPLRRVCVRHRRCQSGDRCDPDLTGLTVGTNSSPS